MNELVDKKSEFYNLLNQYLISCGFSENGDSWMRTTHESTPGRRMIINGQVMEQPGDNIDINIIITKVGDILSGDAKDPIDVWNGPQMIQLNIKRIHNNEEVFNTDFGVDCNDINYIISNINQIL